MDTKPQVARMLRFIVLIVALLVVAGAAFLAGHYYGDYIAILGPSLQTSQGRPPPSKTLTLDCGVGVTMECVLIPAGVLLMGSELPPEEMAKRFGGLPWSYLEEYPQHAVTISKPFYLGRYEVTQSQWQAVLGKNPSHFSRNYWGRNNVHGADTSNHPVESVTWDECQDFCKMLSVRSGRSVRLPTEAEWEYACRAGTTTRFSFGDDKNLLGQYAWYSANHVDTTHPVGQKKPNAWGLYDMYGNVWEQCADWYDKYPGSTGPLDSSRRQQRIQRGGSIYDTAEEACCSAYRGSEHPDWANDTQGLRVVVDAE